MFLVYDNILFQMECFKTFNSSGMSKLLIFLFFITSFQGLAQQAKPTPPVEDTYEKIYQERIKKQRLNGVYIPKDLYDAFTALDRLMDPETRGQFAALEEERAGKKFYLIMWIVNNWSFYEGSRLSHYVRNIGITYPEHMAHFIITTYHRQLNKKELNIGERVAFYQQKTLEEKERKAKNSEILFEEKRIREKKN